MTLPLTINETLICRSSLHTLIHNHSGGDSVALGIVSPHPHPPTPGSRSPPVQVSPELSPSKHAGSDPEAFWLRPVMAITASVQPESARIHFSSVFCCFCFCFLLLFFQRRPGSYCAKPTQIRSGWPGFGPHSEHRFPAPSSLKEGCGKPVLGVWVWPNTSGQETSWCAGIIWPGFWQDVTDPLPVSPFPTRFRSSTDVPDSTVQNQPGSDLVLPDRVRFGSNGTGPEASQCARIIRPASGKCFPADPDRMRIGPGMFTGHRGLRT